ncbi:ROK family transcriptional regulator [Agromyces marinus]|uniref:Sugar kinase n=1 Tax=Agromyces marinus TaxID=1389020 RepID=A0ABM8GZV9_9MICO|nr:ROK family transcriptional regulator [Agromyces marinus]UIP57794.1 N-acetyl-D-glucosamine kinase [Agromyces marinus]BDZ54025.1 sugar kinase [Agromyces marinus]
MVHDTRELNRIAVLTDLLRNRPASRKRLAEATGISPATVTRAVDQLIAQGLVVEASELVTDQRGRRAVLLDVVADRTLVLGVDLGASSTRVLLADLVGRPLADLEVATPSEADAAGLAGWLADLAVELADARWPDVDTIVLGLPGSVGRGSRITNAPNLPQVQDPDFLATLRERTGRRVHADNDANLALLGEQRFGAARDAPTAVMVTIGTGLGAGLAIDGHILRGAQGVVGEFGQLPAGPLGTRLELLVTGPGIMRLAAEAGVRLDSPAELFDPSPAEPVRTLRSHFDQALLVVLSAATVSCEPEVIVLGGGIAKSLAADLERYETMLAHHLGTAPRLVGSELGDFAGATGAVVAALHEIYRGMGVDERALGDLPVALTAR